MNPQREALLALRSKPKKYPAYFAITNRNNIAYEHAVSLSYDMTRLYSSITHGINPYTSITTVSRAILLDLKPVGRDLWPRLGQHGIKSKAAQIEHAKVTLDLIAKRLRGIQKGYMNFDHATRSAK